MVEKPGRLRIVPISIPLNDDDGRVIFRYQAIAPEGFQWDNGNHSLVAESYEWVKKMAIGEPLVQCPKDCVCREE